MCFSRNESPRAGLSPKGRSRWLSAWCARRRMVCPSGVVSARRRAIGIAPCILHGPHGSCEFRRVARAIKGLALEFPQASKCLERSTSIVMLTLSQEA